MFRQRCNALMRGQDPVVILRRALEIIREPEQWTPRARALSSQQTRVSPDHPDAVRWCIEGAVTLACGSFGIMPPYFMRVLDETSYEYGCDGVNLLEEALNHEGVVEFLERVIERLQVPSPEG